MTGKKDIGGRLENWSTWCRTVGAGGQGTANCMTGAVCERMRRASLGDVWSGHEVRDDWDLDEKDAVRIERAMPLLPLAQRLLLFWCYIEQARPEVVCRKCSIPKTEFVERFRAAQEAIEDIVDGGNR